MLIERWPISINFIELLIVALQLVSLQRWKWYLWNLGAVLKIFVQVFYLVHLLLGLCQNWLVVVCWPVEVLKNLHFVAAALRDWNVWSFQVFLVNYIVNAFTIMSTDVFSFGIILVLGRMNWKILFFQLLLIFISLRMIYCWLIETLFVFTLIFGLFSSISSSICIKSILEFIF